MHYFFNAAHEFDDDVTPFSLPEKAIEYFVVMNWKRETCAHLVRS